LSAGAVSGFAVSAFSGWQASMKNDRQTTPNTLKGFIRIAG